MMRPRERCGKSHHAGMRLSSRVPRLGARGAAPLTALTALLLVLGSPLTARADAKAPTGFFSVVDPFPGVVLPSDLGRMVYAHVRSIHTGIVWPQVEPVRGGYRWSRTDRIIGDLASRGIRTFPYVVGSPKYVANAPYKPPLNSSKARKRWAGFLRALVNRYGPGGEFWTNRQLYHRRYPRAKPVPITTWQIWHEPNLAKYFLPKPSPSKYAKLLRISHAAITKADRHAKVIVAGLPAYPKLTAWGFLKRLYKQNGIKRDFDGVALHPYAGSVALQARAIKRVHVVLKRRDKRTPIWITELGWGSRPPDRFHLNKGLAGQARYLKKSFRMVLRHRRNWNIKRVFWFRWRDPIQDRCYGSIACSAGLLRPNGDPKPAYAAFRRFTTR